MRSPSGELLVKAVLLIGSQITASVPASAFIARVSGSPNMRLLVVSTAYW